MKFSNHSWYNGKSESNMKDWQIYPISDQQLPLVHLVLKDKGDEISYCISEQIPIIG